MEKGADKRPSAPGALQSLLLFCFTERLCFLSASLKLPFSRSWWIIELAVTGHRMGAAACKMIESLPCYSAGVIEVYAFDCVFPMLPTFYVKVFHEVSGFGRGFFTDYGSRESFVGLATFLVPGRDEVMAETTRNGFLYFPEKMSQMDL